MYIVNIFLFFLFAQSLEISSGFRILVLYPLPKQSHFKVFDRLARGLADKGHQVDFISIMDLKTSHPNYTQVLKLQDSVNSPVFNNYNALQSIKFDYSALTRAMSLRCEAMRDPKFLNFARNPPKDPPYDLILISILYPCYLVLGHLWNVPVVNVVTASLFPWLYELSGNPENTIFSPNLFFIPQAEGTDFWSRFFNAHAFNLMKWNYLYNLKYQDEIIRKYFGPNVPPVRELMQDISLTLTNTYFPLHGNIPTTANIVEIGGIHIEKDDTEYISSLKKWLDESKSGAVYFSLGSIYSLDTFPERISKVVLASLEKISPVRVLMRVENPDNLTIKIPNNVLTMSWIPQESVLQHPNIKAFITHGGALGTQEAVHYGVPMLCVPYAFDHWSNCYNYAQRKIAVKVVLESATEEELDSALNEILYNPVYKENVKRMSKTFRNRPLSPLDTAIFWIDYVIQHGKDVLRSPAMDLTWWQLALVDVYAVTIFGIVVILLAIILVVKEMLRFARFAIRSLKSIKEKRN